MNELPSENLHLFEPTNERIVKIKAKLNIHKGRKLFVIAKFLGGNEKLTICIFLFFFYFEFSLNVFDKIFN